MPEVTNRGPKMMYTVKTDSLLVKHIETYCTEHKLESKNITSFMDNMLNLFCKAMVNTPEEASEDLQFFIPNFGSFIYNKKKTKQKEVKYRHWTKEFKIKEDFYNLRCKWKSFLKT